MLPLLPQWGTLKETRKGKETPTAARERAMQGDTDQTMEWTSTQRKNAGVHPHRTIHYTFRENLSWRVIAVVCIGPASCWHTFHPRSGAGRPGHTVFCIWMKLWLSFREDRSTRQKRMRSGLVRYGEPFTVFHELDPDSSLFSLAWGIRKQLLRCSQRQFRRGRFC